VDDRLRELADEIARQDEHSHLTVDGRRRIADVILDVERTSLEETARQLVERLPAEDLRAIVADWLDSRIAI
jgi:hypothetical protein